jgi:hypothetical protein
MASRRISFALLVSGVIVGVALSIIAMTASAHHGWSGYDEQLVSLTGSIAEAAYTNPHAAVQLKTSEKTWNVILAPPSRMQARGLTKEMLKTGEPAKVEGYANKSDPNELRAERIVIAGTTIELR